MDNMHSGDNNNQRRNNDNYNNKGVYNNNQYQNSKDNNNNNNSSRNNNNNNNNNNDNNNSTIKKRSLVNRGYEERKGSGSPNIFQRSQEKVIFNNNQDNQNKQKQAESFSNVHYQGQNDQDRHLNPNNQMVAQSLISGRAAGLIQDNQDNNKLHVSSHNNSINNGTISRTKPNQNMNQFTRQEQEKHPPLKPKFKPITGHRDIDKLIYFAQKNSQYSLEFVNKQKPYYLRSQLPKTDLNRSNDQEEQKRIITQSTTLYQTFSINCELSLSSSGNNKILIYLIFNLLEPNRFPELIICDQRIAITPGILQRIGYQKLRRQWDIKNYKALYILLESLTQGILSLNQMEFEHKLTAVLSEDIVSSCIQGEAISQSVAYLQQLALQNQYAAKGIEINLQEFDQNMKTFRHYINCGQIQDVKTLQLFNLSLTIDISDPNKQYIITIIFYTDSFEMRMKPPRNTSVTESDNKQPQFNKNFFYDFMRSNGGYQPESYSQLKRKLQIVSKKIIALSDSQRYRKMFLNKLLHKVSDYGILYDVDTKQAYKLSIAVKIKGKLTIFMIQLGDLFPNDTIQISMMKNIETSNQRSRAIFGVTAKKKYIYEVNGVRIRDFSDQDMHEIHANDIMQFLRDVIIEQERVENRQNTYGYQYYGYR